MRLRRDTTNLFELVATFSGRGQRLSCDIHSDERLRLLELLSDGFATHRFIAVSPTPGYEIFLNTTHLLRLNILEPLPGIQVEIETPPAHDDEDSAVDPSLNPHEIQLRIWLRGDPEPILHSSIAAEEWPSIRSSLENGDRFIAFSDEDREAVLYGTDHLDAIELLDPTYLTAEQIDTIMGNNSVELPPSKPDDVPF